MSRRVWGSLAVAAGIAVAIGCGKKDAGPGAGGGGPSTTTTQPGAQSTPPAGASSDTAAADKKASAQNLRDLALATKRYADLNNGYMPLGLAGMDGGETRLSWRVSVLPFIGHADLFKQFNWDERWDGPTNKPLIAKMPAVFAAPGKNASEGMTYYQAFAGNGTAFEQPTYPMQRNKNFIRGTRLPASFTDGLSNTVLFVEAAGPVVWTKPEDIEFDPGKPLPKLGGLFPDGHNLAFADGAVRFIPTGKLTDDQLKALVTTKGNEPTDFLKEFPSYVFEKKDTGTEAGTGAAAKSDPATYKKTSAENLRKLVLATHDQGDTNNSYMVLGFADPEGKTIGLGWRVGMLPSIGQMDLYKQFKLDEPWDGPTNKPLIAKMPAAFVAPGPAGAQAAAEGKTYYQAFAGKGAFIDFPTEPEMRKRWVRNTRLPSSFTDGLANIAVFAEAAEPVVWTKPDDLNYAADQPPPKLGGLFPDGYHLAFEDGEVRFIPRGKLTDDQLKALITLRGNEPVDFLKEFPSYAFVKKPVGPPAVPGKAPGAAPATK